jgi:hypothetical protein
MDRHDGSAASRPADEPEDPQFAMVLARRAVAASTRRVGVAAVGSTTATLVNLAASGRALLGAVLVGVVWAALVAWWWHLSRRLLPTTSALVDAFGAEDAQRIVAVALGRRPSVRRLRSTILAVCEELLSAGNEGDCGRGHHPGCPHRPPRVHRAHHWPDAVAAVLAPVPSPHAGAV